jgi:predicted nuclease with TOPRIM domain
MPENKNRIANALHILRRAQDDTAESADNAPDDSNRGIIELDDRTVGPEAEINRLKAKLLTVSEEISQLRHENAKLESEHRNLKAEFREFKLVLAKLEIKELRAVERVGSWMRSLRML